MCTESHKTVLDDGSSGVNGCRYGQARPVTGLLGTVDKLTRKIQFMTAGLQCAGIPPISQHVVEAGINNVQRTSRDGFKDAHQKSIGSLSWKPCADYDADLKLSSRNEQASMQSFPNPELIRV